MLQHLQKRTVGHFLRAVAARTTFTRLNMPGLSPNHSGMSGKPEHAQIPSVTTLTRGIHTPQAAQRDYNISNYPGIRSGTNLTGTNPSSLNQTTSIAMFSPTTPMTSAQQISCELSTTSVPLHPPVANTGAERSHHIAQLAELPPNTPVQLSGWVERHRLLGGLLFLTLRDHTGSIQCAWSEAEAKTDEADHGLTGTTAGLQGYATATKIAPESVVSVYGYIRPRPEGMERAGQGASGRFEVRIQSFKLLNAASPLPITYLSGPTSQTSNSAESNSNVNSRQQSDDDALLKYRFLELRLPEMQRILRTRAKITLAARQELYNNGFIEVETPLLVKSTPEGAREFLVPTRSPGRFYALPQSPQQHKQLLMAAGVDRYFQIARCFRDESGRQDRQPEFTQIDMEMSFVGQEEVISTLEQLFFALHKAVHSSLLPSTTLMQGSVYAFPRMRFRDALNRYGSDKPDIRFGLEMVDVSSVFRRFASIIDGSDPLVDTCMHIDATFLDDHLAEVEQATGHARARDVRPCIKVLRVPGLKVVKQTNAKSKTKNRVGAGENQPITTQKELIEALQVEAKLGGASGALVIDTAKWKVPASMKLVSNAEVQQAIMAAIDSEIGQPQQDVPSTLFIVAGNWMQTCNALGRVRSLLGKLCMEGTVEIDGQSGFTGDKTLDMKSSFFHNRFLAEKGLQSPLLGWHVSQGRAPLPTFHWVVDFPLFEIEDVTSLSIHSSHHPFTAPHPDDMSNLLELAKQIPTFRNQMSSANESLSKHALEAIANLAQLRALHYDLVSNGLEVGGGSIRLHSKDAQEAVFSLLDVSNDKFAHLLQALSLGCPPHGGFAAGLDRVTAILASMSPSPLRLRDVIAFPKTLTGKDLLLQAPAAATKAQLEEYCIRTIDE